MRTARWLDLHGRRHGSGPEREIAVPPPRFFLSRTPSVDDASSKLGGERLAPVLPLHLVGDPNIQRSRGRPKRIEPAPLKSDLDYHSAVARERLEHVEADEVVRALAERADARVLLGKIAEALAREAAVLEHERLETQKRGRDVGQLVSRRVETLKKLADLQVEIQNLGVAVLDPHSLPIQRMFELWVADVVEVATQVMQGRRELLDLFIEALARKAEGFEERAEDALR